MSLDKNELYGTFQESTRRNNKLTDDITRKALDLPRGDDDVNITTTNNGVGGMAMAGILAGVMAAGGGGAVMMNQVMQQPATPRAIVQPDDASFTILHRNADGDIIDVPQWKPGAQE